MALDNYDRVEGLNAVVQAWTHFNSLPFVTRKYIANGGTVKFNVTHPFRGVFLFFGANANYIGAYMTNVTTSGSSATTKAISSASGISISYNSTLFQFTITSTGGSCNMVIFTIEGSTEEEV